MVVGKRMCDNADAESVLAASAPIPGTLSGSPAAVSMIMYCAKKLAASTNAITRRATGLDIER